MVLNQNVNFMKLNLNDHPINNPELRANFKKDTGMDWNTKMTEFLLYVNIAVVKANAG